MVEELLLRQLVKWFPGIERPGSRFIVYGMAFVFFCVTGLIAMMLWIIFSPLPKASDFVQKSGTIQKVVLKELQDKGMKNLWLYLDNDAKLYVFRLSKGPDDVLTRLAVGETITLTLRASDLTNPKRAEAISVTSPNVKMGNIEEYIRRKAESKKYAWVILFPAALGLYFCYVLREKNVEMGWEIELNKKSMLNG